ncbi:MAG: amidinotransferase [Sphingobacteriales bacterium]|nr:amidinotransferase [Sphingobacteriales bacterium]
MSAASSILMIRPIKFGFNQQTAESNAFQTYDPNTASIQQRALKEFDAFVDVLKANGVNVIIINDTNTPHKPDSIFPNNWISFNDDGRVFLFPMEAENRRLERRTDIIDYLKEHFKIREVIDLSYFESQSKFLESTGSMILDRDNHIVYACVSSRTDKEVLDYYCNLTGFKPITFSAIDLNGIAIYHTNVMICLAEKFAIICLDAISSQQERELVINSLNQSHKEIITISFEQMNDFAGNMLELQSKTGEKLLVMSERAYKSLDKKQLKTLNRNCKIIFSPLTTIENIGGGSARCMIAEIHLPAES